MLYHIPIEPYQTRYTADWIDEFEKEFVKNNIQFKTILGCSLTDSISEPGNVLDAVGTNIYKNSQMQKILSLFANNAINDGDIFFFCDLWFPSIEMLFYIRNITKINFKIAGILHAGTYDTNDFTFRCGMRNWGKHLEDCWLSEIDYIFVATHYHKDLIQQHSNELGNIFVTGIPFYAKDLQAQYRCTVKNNIVIFPHRIAPEKHPELFDSLENIVHKKYGRSDISFIKTIDVTHSREQYFKLLSQSKVMISFAEQETFGFATLESLALGCKVLAPNRLSYIETLPEDCRYDMNLSIDDLAKKVIFAIDNYTVPVVDLEKWSFSVHNMLYILKGEDHV